VKVNIYLFQRPMHMEMQIADMSLIDSIGVSGAVNASFLVGIIVQIMRLYVLRLAAVGLLCMIMVWWSLSETEKKDE